MTTEVQLQKQFEEHMRREEERSSNNLAMGETSKDGKLLILGGYKADLWRLRNGLYEVGLNQTALATTAIKDYNLYNGTNLSEDYISEVFYPWYEKQFKVIAEIPSDSKPGLVYKIRRGPDGKLTCECIGFRIRGTCKHVEYIKEVEEGAQ
jgi:hypothetical protein